MHGKPENVDNVSGNKSITEINLQEGVELSSLIAP